MTVDNVENLKMFTHERFKLKRSAQNDGKFLLFNGSLSQFLKSFEFFSLFTSIDRQCEASQ